MSVAEIVDSLDTSDDDHRLLGALEESLLQADQERGQFGAWICCSAVTAL